MVKTFALLTSSLLLFSCSQQVQEMSSIDPINWEKRTVLHWPSDSLTKGSSYLSVYSQIYSQTEHRTHNLTATVSLRNTNRHDTIYIDKAEYFGTNGSLIRTYFNSSIFIAPMETVEIVIDEQDQEGGTGANFLFEWRVKQNKHEPIFEAIMISTSGSQGLSFTTQAKRLE